MKKKTIRYSLIMLMFLISAFSCDSCEDDIDWNKLPAETHEGKTWYGNFNLDFLIRAGVVYNNGKYFVGTSFVGKNYNYHRNNFSLDNGFGTLQIYVGFNFNLRKEYRRKNTR